MDNASNPPRKPPVRPFFGPRSPATTPPSSTTPLGRPAPRPFTSRATPIGQSVRPSDLLASAAPPGEDKSVNRLVDQVIADKSAIPERTRNGPVGEQADVATPQADRAPFYGEAPVPESPPWRPTDGFDTVTDSAAQSAVVSPPLDAGTAAIGVVDIMEWMPVPGSDADSSHGEALSESGQTSNSAVEVAGEAAVVSTAPSDTTITESPDPYSDAWAEADIVPQESTRAADTVRVVPTLATPAFGELTVGNGAESSHPASDESPGSIAAQEVVTAPGDTWKWGEPSTPELSGNAVAADDDSQTIGGPEAPYAVTLDEASTTTVDLQPEPEPSAEAVTSLEEVKESEPWTMSAANPLANRGDAIGDALERIAKRIREGKIILPADATASNDEAALALALTALLRGRSE